MNKQVLFVVVLGVALGSLWGAPQGDPNCDCADSDDCCDPNQPCTNSSGESNSCSMENRIHGWTSEKKMQLSVPITYNMGIFPQAVKVAEADHDYSDCSMDDCDTSSSEDRDRNCTDVIC